MRFPRFPVVHQLAVLLIASVAFSTLVFSTAASAERGDPIAERIVNGQAAAFGELPHQVLIMQDGQPGCGGSIVGPSTVVSAAHCFDPSNPTSYSIRAGVLDYRDTSGQDRAVVRVINHPDFNFAQAPDVAVLQLASPLVFDSRVSSIALANPSEISIGQSAVVSGWGALSDAGVEYPDELLKTTVTLIGDAECEASLAAEEPGTTIVDALELCASSSPGDSCYGDSGGPLTVGTGSQARLGGIVSWGLLCGPPSPGIYAEVPAIAEWIAANAGEALTGTLGGVDPSPTEVPTATPVPVPEEGTCNGLTITVDLSAGQLPTNGPDVIAGTAGDDLIAAGGGNDVVCGLGGNDTIWGQGGNDVLLGGDGDDKLRGGRDNDELRGGDGADDLSGGNGDDRVYGEAGNDTKVRGGVGNDMVDGGDGDDALIAGNGGEDMVLGGRGNDRATGGPRPDTVDGGDGADEIRGNKGADILIGGRGNDRLFGGPQADNLDGGDGTDDCNGGNNSQPGNENDQAAGCEGSLVNIP